ncbi:hypothetical protein AVEN_43818-1 [Araneus ventricosus]|uniref:Uncharacterized protein n=1 Tax=Araneus ventricosus TaxID=182803 RepID=A0A4Y2I1S0_ARAVE|nr:hypothetical protein AVEN_43818-1 [Araneus ventricosus]
MLLCRFSHVEGCSQNALCGIMQRSAVCVSTWAIYCRGKVKPFQGRGKWGVSCEKQDFFPFPVAWLSCDSFRMLNVDLPVFSSSQPDSIGSIPDHQFSRMKLEKRNLFESCDGS